MMRKKCLAALLCALLLLPMLAIAEDDREAALQKREAAIESLAKTYGTPPFWPLEEWVALDALSLSLGILETPTHGLPEAGEIQAEEAIAIATAALQEAYAISDEEMSSLYAGASFLVVFPEVGRAWQISFVPDTEASRREGTTEEYNVALRADTGEIIDILPPVA